ncbi:MAG TPA: hypothetical protein PLQ20_00835 [Candidatus Paceibacterota bacterium]|nr:hypothetical protein [Candidatus Paceibacterota bacterium]
MKKNKQKPQNFGCNYNTVVINAAKTAIEKKENFFVLGSGKKQKKFSIVTHFASENGWLCPATNGGYQHSLRESYDNYEICVDRGSAGRMFHVVYDNKENIFTVLNPAFKQVLFLKEKKPSENGAVVVDFSKSLRPQNHSADTFAEMVTADLQSQIGGGDVEDVFLKRQKMDSPFSKKIFFMFPRSQGVFSVPSKIK